MQFGMNVVVSAKDSHLASHGASAVKFIKACGRSGIAAIRLSWDSGALTVGIERAIAEVVEQGMKLTIAPRQVTPENVAQELATWQGAEYNTDVALYSRLCEMAPASSTLAMVMPIGLEMITKTSMRPGAVGIKREAINRHLAEVAATVKASGFKVAMPMRLEDVQANNYTFDFDTIELEGMLSANNEQEMAALAESMAGTKPYWVGRAGMVGGFMMPAHQTRLMRKMETIARAAEYAFLWSEEASDKWAWSMSGRMVVEFMPRVMGTTGSINPNGNQALSNWKTQQRQ